MFMEKGSLGSLLGIIIGIAIVAGLGFLFWNGVRSLGNDDKPQQAQATVAPSDKLTTMGPNHKIKLLVRGPLVADEDARSYTVEISQSQRILTTYTGYNGGKIGETIQGNSPAAYEQLLYSLKSGGFTKANKETNTETRGLCASGRIYRFELIVDNQVNSALWATSCNGARRTLDKGVDFMYLKSLMERQIPGARKTIADLDM